MKLTVNFGDELKHDKITHREKIPVYNNFDNSKLIGEAELLNDGTAEISLIDTYSEKLKSIFEIGLCGQVLEIEENVITDFRIMSASIQVKNPCKGLFSTEP